MFTFKAQAKSNAKRFLVATCKLENFDDYLTQNGEGNWGTYLDAAGKPVPHATVRGEMEGKIAALAAEVNAAIPAAPAAEPMAALAAVAETLAEPDAEEEPSVAPAPSASAFGAFALGQLTASATAAPAPAARTQREGATPTAGLKIQKDRPLQNGVRRQSAGSVGDKLWALFDAAGPAVTLEQAKALATEANLSPTSAAIALYNWRKFNGIPSRAGK